MAHVHQAASLVCHNGVGDGGERLEGWGTGVAVQASGGMMWSLPREPLKIFAAED